MHNQYIITLNLFQIYIFCCYTDHHTTQNLSTSLLIKVLSNKRLAVTIKLKK